VRLAAHEYVLAACCAVLIVLGLSACSMLGAGTDESGGTVLTLPDGSEVVLSPPAGATEPSEYELPDGSVVVVRPQAPATAGAAVGRSVGGVIGTVLGLPPALVSILAAGVSAVGGALGGRKA